MKIFQSIWTASTLLVSTSYNVNAFSAITPGTKFPNVQVYKEFGPETMDLGDYIQNKSVMVVGLPGAFTPT